MNAYFTEEPIQLIYQQDGGNTIVVDMIIILVLTLNDQAATILARIP